MSTHVKINANAEKFHIAVATQITNFKQAVLIQRLMSGEVTMENYHTILTTIFHQTYSSPYTFAEAAANCSWHHSKAKEYLLTHAEEERTHWRWVLDDLKNSNYKGDDPRLFFPHPSTEAYISFNERVAKRMPIARLAIACVLEGIGGQLGNTYGKKIVQILGLTKEQTSFFLSHGETDKHHMHELAEVINGSELSPEEWGWMTQAATVAGQLYSNMYSHEGFH